jgi:hypothetical protein
MSFSEKIFSSGAVSETFLYFCLHGASTAWVLQCELNMPEATVYRALKRLRAIGVLVPALKVSKVKRSKGGPRPTVWAVDTASPDEVSSALRLHYKMLSPKRHRRAGGPVPPRTWNQGLALTLPQEPSSHFGRGDILNNQIITLYSYRFYTQVTIQHQ